MNNKHLSSSAVWILLLLSISVASAKNVCKTKQVVNIPNVSLIKFLDLPEQVCASQSLAPKIVIQNLDVTIINSIQIELKVDGTSCDTIRWRGWLENFENDTLQMGTILLKSQDVVQAKIILVNGSSGFELTNNLKQEIKGPFVLQSFSYKLGMITHSCTQSIYWQITNSSGEILFDYGNPGVVGRPIGPYDIKRNDEYTWEIEFPVDDCYTLDIYHSSADLTNCGDEFGLYYFMDNRNMPIIDSTEFSLKKSYKLDISNSHSSHNRVRILDYNWSDHMLVGWRSDEIICTDTTIQIEPDIIVQNIGTNTIHSIDIALDIDNGFNTNITWMGELESMDTAHIRTKRPIPIGPGDFLVAEVQLVNGDHCFCPFNRWIVSLFDIPNRTRRDKISFRLELDNSAHETYWEIVNELEFVISSGGNKKAKENQGGQEITSPSDPGAYSPNTVIDTTITLPIQDMFYTLKIYDDGGDGIRDDKGGILSLHDSDGNTLVGLTNVGFPFSLTHYKFSQSGAVSSVEDQTFQLSIHPNPASEYLFIKTDQHQQLNPNKLSIYLVDILGRIISIPQDSWRVIENNSIILHSKYLPNGQFTIVVDDTINRVTGKLLLSN